MGNVWKKTGRENQNPYFMLRNFFVVENHTVYGIMWRNLVFVDSDRPQLTM
jgi:hypothetical protein